MTARDSIPDPSTTALYMHRVSSAQMTAQEKFLDAIKLTSAAG